MARLKICGCCYLLTFVPKVLAESGDDFSNNLVSDLAPLLTLFGERVTMQFMSQSTGWADNIALAMAPLGVITIIVGAIRVGGPSWLRALIGRARENTAVAEAELMSSTSNEVCELWNGQEVVRVIGTAPIQEFICLTPPGRSMKGLKPTFCSLDKAMEKGYMKRHETSTFQRLWSLISHICYPVIQPYEDEEAGANTDSKNQPELNDLVVIHNSKIQAPNLSFNIHNFNKRSEIQAVAAIGTLLQAAVILYAAFATYYPTLRFAKEGSTVGSYAFPCMATGSVVLVLGMLIAAHVVESSTEEERYRPKDGMLAWVFWLQKAETVSDQSFESFLISTETPKDLIMTSQRADPRKSGKFGLGVVEYWLELLTIIATAISVSGYVIQFVGLRGLHWSITIVQLGATVLMTVLRAWVRRGLSQPPQVQKIPSDFELDWFATQLALRDTIYLHGWQDEKRESIEIREQRKEKRAASSTGVSREPWETNTRKDVRRAFSSTALSQSFTAQKILQFRSQLGHASKWPGIAYKEAMAAANAIEIRVDFGNSQRASPPDSEVRQAKGPVASGRCQD
ncbi:uncharacterized protein LDX57_000932 [Aspergillus melleus]|uniref:uncharacterized protein n=1 Tax=Aspergillus melleus TaxID=138277 RepID=UPI001E8E7A7E|nr:uncharacterized protein LDX57_000932 [Aspergillus melleus]KAH8423178.1 hypothetical protein LDX57_000932 [Aspergillus melleus]